jgi:Fic family protein
LDEAIHDLHGRLGGLPRPPEAEEIWDEFWHQEAHHSTALEGNTLVLNQVRHLLDEGRAVGSKELREYVEVAAYASAARWVYGEAVENGIRQGGTLLTLQEVRSIHAKAMGPVWDVSPHPNALPDEGPGNWRRHEIRPFPGGMKPPPWTDVPPRIRDWVSEVNETPVALKRSPLPGVLAAHHCQFERIHPFLDGNGRTGRLLLNLILVRLSYPPAIIQKRSRARYLQALRRADAGDAGPLGELIARAVTESLHKFVLPAVAGPARLVPLASLASKDVSSEALRVAAIRGRLRAVQAPTGWMSSRKWVDDYLASKYKRKPR